MTLPFLFSTHAYPPWGRRWCPATPTCHRARHASASLLSTASVTCACVRVCMCLCARAGVPVRVPVCTRACACVRVPVCACLCDWKRKLDGAHRDHCLDWRAATAATALRSPVQWTRYAPPLRTSTAGEGGGERDAIKGRWSVDRGRITDTPFYNTTWLLFKCTDAFLPRKRVSSLLPRARVTHTHTHAKARHYIHTYTGTCHHPSPSNARHVPTTRLLHVLFGDDHCGLMGSVHMQRPTSQRRKAQSVQCIFFLL